MAPRNMDLASAGSGPGAQAADGCSVELYRRLPYLGDLDSVRAYLRPGSTVLELGCGAGRLTRVLIEFGLQPTCVDNCAEMLAHLPPGATALHADLESLSLPQRFDLVLLASCLVNHPDVRVRNAFIGCAARHSRAGGVVLIERQDPEWLRTAPAGWQGRAGPALITVDHVQRAGEFTRMRLRYVIGVESWAHEFCQAGLPESEIEALLQAHGFVAPRWHGVSRRWVAASYDPA